MLGQDYQDIAYSIERNHEMSMLVMTQNGAFDLMAFLRSL
jgi:hypothetical protein